MSYSIHIGEPYVDSSCESDEFFCRWTVKGITQPDAPNFPGDTMTGNSNGRHPSYSGWAEFCRRNGLEATFFDAQEGLMRDHPGCFPLNAEHLKAFKEALEQREKIDKRPAGLDPRLKDLWVQVPVEGQTHDYDKARLIWLVWWTEWALKNCKHPAISNS